MALESFSHPNMSQVRDVTIASPQDDEVLTYSGSSWINAIAFKPTRIFTTNDSSAAIKTALEAASNGDWFHFKTGEHTFNSGTVTLSKNLRITGEGWYAGGTDLKASSVANGLHLFDLTGNVLFENIQLSNQLLVTQDAGALIHLNNASGISQAVFRGVEFRNNRSGATNSQNIIKHSAGEISELDFSYCHFVNSGALNERPMIHLWDGNGVDTRRISNLSFNHCRFTNSVLDYCVKCEVVAGSTNGPNNVIMHDVNVENGAGGTLWLEGGRSCNITNVRHGNDGGYTQVNHRFHFKGSGEAETPRSEFELSRCQFGGEAADFAVGIMDVYVESDDGTGAGVIEECWTRYPDGHTIRLDLNSCTGIKVAYLPTNTSILNGENVLIESVATNGYTAPTFVAGGVAPLGGERVAVIGTADQIQLGVSGFSGQANPIVNISRGSDGAGMLTVDETGLTLGGTAGIVIPAGTTGERVATESRIRVNSTTGTTEIYRNLAWRDLEAGGGSGDVTKVGTPVDNEIGVWTGDGTIEGDTNFTWGGTLLSVTNPTDTATEEVARFGGLRATPTAGDAITQTFYLADSAGAAAQFAGIKAGAETTTFNAKDGSLKLEAMVQDTLREAMKVNGKSLAGAPVGEVTFGWADLRMAATEYSPLGSGFTFINSTGEVTFSMVRSILSSALLNSGVDGDGYRRLVIEAGGKLNWGPGNAARDTNLYRSFANVLATDDSFSVGSELRVGANLTARMSVNGDADEIQLLVQGHSTQTNPIFRAQLSDGTTNVFDIDTAAVTLGDAVNIVLNATTGTKFGTATSQKLAFYNSTPIVQPTALTTALTQITHTEPGTPDYAIQDMTSTSPFGFVTQDEANTALKVIKNLQVRVDELETKLKSLGLVA